MHKRKQHDNDAQLELPDFRVHVPIVKVPQPDGSVLVKAGKPQILENEIGTAEFARMTGMSQSYVELLCNEGKLQWRRMTPKAKSKFLIPASEVTRYLGSNPNN